MMLSKFKVTFILYLQSSLDDEELLRCITPNEKEDFLLLSKKGLTLRTFTNTARGKGDKMEVEEYRRIKIVEPQNPDPDAKTN